MNSMATSKDKIMKRNLLIFCAKIGLFLLTYEIVQEKGSNLVMRNFVLAESFIESEINLSSLPEDDGSMIWMSKNFSFQSKIDEKFGAGRSCRYVKFIKRLICRGSVDFSYLKTIKQEEIIDFIVDKYSVEGACQKENKTVAVLNRNNKPLSDYPTSYQKLTGQVQLKNTELRINVIGNLTPSESDPNQYSVTGEAFSTKVLKIFKNLLGVLTINYINNRTIVTVNIKTTEANSTWDFRSNLTFVKRNPKTMTDEWSLYGIIKTKNLLQNQIMFFGGSANTTLKDKECKFSGETNLQNANLVWSFTGRVTSPYNKQITLPKESFSDMSIKHIIFKESNFFNDFDKDVFKGLNGVERISFFSSKLENMPFVSDFLKNLPNLTEIYFEDCTTPNLKFGTNPTLQNVHSMSFKGTGPLYLDDFSFFWLKHSNLTFLNFKNSYIKLFYGAKSVLRGINHSLTHLDISHSNLKTENDLLAILNSLKIIHLTAEELRLRQIPRKALSSVRFTLEYLSLKGNNFGKLLEKDMFNTIFDFPLMFRLRELNLMDCHINYIEMGAFDSLPKLEILHIGKNNLENLQDGWAMVKPKIFHLDLGGNGLTTQVSFLTTNTMGTTLNLSIFTELKVLNLSNGIFLNTKKIIESLGNNLQQLKLKNIDLKDLPGDAFKKFKDLKVLDLSFNKNVALIQTFSVTLFKYLKNLECLILQGCRINTIMMTHPFGYVTNGDADTLENLKYLDLSHNNIKVIDSTALKAFPHLKILNLTGNGITSWNNSLIAENKNLKEIYLDENKIDTLTDNMLSDIRNLKKVKLGNNPYLCGPYVYEIIKMAEKEPCLRDERGNESIYAETNDEISKVRNVLNFSEGNSEPETESNLKKKCDEVSILDWSENSYVCFSQFKSKFIFFGKVNESFENAIVKKRKDLNGLGLFSVLGVVVTLVMVVRKIVDIHVIAKAVRNAVVLSFLSRSDNEPVKYQYNVFVSYSDKDRSWVIEQLLPRLESNKEIKVCLHERDFQVGLSILENIIASIDSSCNIVLVLSKSFVKSHWCQYEMHLAQHRLLEKGRDQLVLILLENIPLVKRPKTLRYLMMTKTYLEWPVNPKSLKEIEVFWNRLLKAINHH